MIRDDENGGENTIKESKVGKLILYSQKYSNIYIYVSSVVSSWGAKYLTALRCI